METGRAGSGAGAPSYTRDDIVLAGVGDSSSEVGAECSWARVGGVLTVEEKRVHIVGSDYR